MWYKIKSHFPCPTLVIWSVTLILLSVLVYSVLPVAAQENVTFTALVEPSILGVDEILTLELELSGSFRTINKPDFPQLDDFNVLSSGQSSQLSIVNNQISSRVLYTYRLQPLRTVSLTIPFIPITVCKDTAF